MTTDRIENLVTTCVLGRLSIGQAGIYSRSKILRDEIAATHAADPASVGGIVQKLLHEDRAGITKVINAATTTFKAKTLPWDDKAYRLIPVAVYPALQAELSTLENDFHDAVAEMLSDDNYNRLRAEYHQRVNSVLAAEIPFPSKADLQRGFRFELGIMPLVDPDDLHFSEDLRLQVDPAALNSIRSKVNAQMDEKLRDANAAIVGKLYPPIANVVKICSDKDARVFKTLISNIEDIVDVLPMLNINHDPEIDRLIQRVKNAFVGIDVEVLKKNPSYRADTAKVAEKVLDDIKNFGNSPAPIVQVPQVPDLTPMMNPAPVAPVAPAVEPEYAIELAEPEDGLTDEELAPLAATVAVAVETPPVGVAAMGRESVNMGAAIGGDDPLLDALKNFAG